MNSFLKAFSLILIILCLSLISGCTHQESHETDQEKTFTNYFDVLTDSEGNLVLPLNTTVQLTMTVKRYWMKRLFWQKPSCSSGINWLTLIISTWMLRVMNCTTWLISISTLKKRFRWIPDCLPCSVQRWIYRSRVKVFSILCWDH